MRVIEKQIYTYAELDDSAKARAREWFSSGGYTWIDEGIDSIKAFCNHYNVRLQDYSLSPYAYSYIETDADNQHFRGVTLKKVESEKDLMPTGYCVDADLFITMYESMRDNGGNALQAFKDAIEAGKKSLIADMEYQDSEEHIAEMMEVNGYEFDEEGEIV
jgi:hypothetical protein